MHATDRLENDMSWIAAFSRQMRCTTCYKHDACTYGVLAPSRTAWSCLLHVVLSSLDDRYVMHTCSFHANCVFVRQLAARRLDKLHWSGELVFLALYQWHTALKDWELHRCHHHVLPCHYVDSMVLWTPENHTSAYCYFTTTKHDQNQQTLNRELYTRITSFMTMTHVSCNLVYIRNCNQYSTVTYDYLLNGLMTS